MCAIKSVVKDPMITCNMAYVYGVYVVACITSVMGKVINWHFSKILFNSS